MNCKYRQERNYVNNMLPKLEEILQLQGFSKEDFDGWKKSSAEDYFKQENIYIKDYIK